MRKTLHFILSLLLCSVHAIAQPYYFRHLQVEDGLSNNTVFCSAQDKDGFIWFGTKEGLNRYDGYHFKQFSLQQQPSTGTITADRIFCLLNDSKGALWIGAEKGLYKYVTESEHLIAVEDSLTNVTALEVDKNGRLWFISNNSLYRYDVKNGTTKSYIRENYFNATYVCQDDAGKLWVASDDGFIHQLNADEETFTNYDVFKNSTFATSHWIQTLRRGNNGNLFVGTTNQGLKEFDTHTGTYKDILTYNANKTTIFVRDILRASSDEFWIATESGIFIYNTSNGSFINLTKRFVDPYSVSDNAVYTLCKDDEGSIWAGTFFGGVNYYSREYSAFQKYYPDNTSNAIIGNAVREICEDNNGDLWIGTEDAGLCRIEKSTGKIEHFRPSGNSISIAYTNIHGLMIDGDNLWIGTFEHGIDIMNVKTGKVIKHYIAGPREHDLKSNFALCFLHHSSGEIYVGTSNGFYHYNKKSDDFTRVPQLTSIFFVSSILEDHQHNIWIATNNSGVFKYNVATGETQRFANDPATENSLSNNAINDLYEDSKNNIWIATDGGGVCKLAKDHKTITRYTTKTGLPSNFTFKVLEDNDSNIWITTSKGLCKFNEDGKLGSVYTKSNGLLNDQFNYHSGYKDGDGRLYFGSVKGMISFNPQALIKDSIAPPVYITGFQVHNKELVVGEDSSLLQRSILYTDKVELSYNQSSISIDFAALSFISPVMTQYAYKLDGLDNEWTYLKSNRKVYFTNLSPGTYTFRVKATNGSVWSTAERQLMIKIAPPFWATSWAYLLYYIAGIVFVYYVFQTYHKRHQAKKEKEIYESKIDFFTNVAHEIKTPLTLIKGPVENLMETIDQHPEIKEDVVTMERNTNRLINLVSQILDFRQTEIKSFSLDFEEVNLSQLLNESYVNFKTLAHKKKLHYTLDMPNKDVFAYADEEALTKIFSNLFSNAVKYADKIVNVKMAAAVTIDDNIAIEFENDGYVIPTSLRDKIFEPFYRLKETSKLKGTGIGLTLARSLAELHNGKLYLKETRNDLNVFVLVIPSFAADKKLRKTNEVPEKIN